MKKISEKTIEKAVCKYAEYLGWLVYKFVSPGNRSVPDRIFIKKGYIFMIEFKKPGAKPTKLQEKTINDICREMIPVHIVDSIELGKEIINFRNNP